VSLNDDCVVTRFHDAFLKECDLVRWFITKSVAN
jgi:hypothetical protein